MLSIVIPTPIKILISIIVLMLLLTLLVAARLFTWIIGLIGLCLTSFGSVQISYYVVIFEDHKTMHVIVTVIFFFFTFF